MRVTICSGMMLVMSAFGHQLPLFILLALLCLGGTPSSAFGESASDAMEEAESAFEYQDYRRAVQLYEGLLNSQDGVPDPDRLLVIREHLGASRWFLKDTDAAEREFTILLQAAPNTQLNSFYYPAELLTFFNALRDRLIVQGNLKIGQESNPVKSEEKAPVVLVKTIETVTIRTNPFITTFIPFGGGQFQNGDTTTGVVFLTAETVALAATITTYFLILNNRDNPDLARKYEVGFWVSEGVFVGLVVAGIVEAMINYRAEFPPTIERRTVVDPEQPATTTDSGVRPVFGVGQNSSLFLGFSRSF